jgi:hypothetical protein
MVSLALSVMDSSDNKEFQSGNNHEKNGNHFGSPLRTSLSSSEQNRNNQRKLPQQQSADGTFNGGPIYLKRHATYSSAVHCVGDNFQGPNAWKSQSCRFQNLCFDTSKKDFVIFESSTDAQLVEIMSVRSYAHISDIMKYHSNNNINNTTTTTITTTTRAVSIGGINTKWGDEGTKRLKWFPEVRTSTTLTYYELPESIILAPFHSLNGANPGHLVWDDFLPIFTLLQMFQLSTDLYELLPMRYVLQDDHERALWATCDLREEKRQLCRHMMSKFWPFIAGIHSMYTMSSTVDFEFQENRPGSSNLICAKTGVAGIGALTDHGFKKAHGWEQHDYTITQNHGRGGNLYDFRNFVLRNLNLPVHPLDPNPPHRIVFSINSSEIFNRKMDFQRQIALVKDSFPKAVVEAYTFKELSAIEQVQVASSAAIFITLCGGGAVTAMFLPAGASVILYYSEDGGLANGRRTYKPARLDWDIFNNMSHLRVHWMPRNSMKTDLDERALILLIQHELDMIESQTFP